MSEAEDIVAQVYAAYATLQDQPDGPEASQAYQTLLQIVHKPDDRAKQLLAGFIPQFLPRFPALAERGINAQLDLCEDPAGSIRMLAIRGLLKICENAPAHVPQIADVLGQLLLTEEPQELQTVQHALKGLFAVDFGAALRPILKQMRQDSPPELTAKAVEFYKQQMNNLVYSKAVPLSVSERVSLLTAQLTELVQAKSISGELATTLLQPLRRQNTRPAQRAAHQTLLQAVFELVAPREPPFNPQDSEAVSSLLTLLKLLLGMGLGAQDEPSSQGPALFVLDQLLPVLPQVQGELRAPLARLVLPLAKRCSEQQAREYLPKLYARLLELLPGTAERVEFAVLEPLLAGFMVLAGKAPYLKQVCGVFVPTGQPSERHPDLVLKKERFYALLQGWMQHVEQQGPMAQTLIKELRTLLGQTKEPNEKQELNQKLQSATMAAAAVANVRVMVAALKKNPPRLGLPEAIHLSWQGKPKEAGKKEAKEQEQGKKKNEEEEEKQQEGQGKKKSKNKKKRKAGEEQVANQNQQGNLAQGKKKKNKKNKRKGEVEQISNQNQQGNQQVNQKKKAKESVPKQKQQQQLPNKNTSSKKKKNASSKAQGTNVPPAPPAPPAPRQQKGQNRKRKGSGAGPSQPNKKRMSGEGMRLVVQRG